MRQLIFVTLSLPLMAGCSHTPSNPEPPAPEVLTSTPALDPNYNTENNDFAPSPAKPIDIQGSIGQPYVRLEGLPGEPQTASDGCYQAQVPTGWSGMVRPVCEGLRFSPPQRIYTDINTPAFHEDYQAMSQEVTIAGSLELPGVPILGGPDLVKTDDQGNFRVRVPYGWSGRLIPSLANARFIPGFREYSYVTAPLADQYFQPMVPATPITPSSSPVKAATPTPLLAGMPEALATPALTTPILLWQERAPDYANEIREDLLTLATILMDVVLKRSNLVCPDPQADIHFPQGMYIEGFGVLFTLRLESPLPVIAASEPNNEMNTTSTANENLTTWQRTRQRLFAAEDTTHASSTQPLNQAYLDRLVQRTAQAMQQAVHIRHLTNDDRITVALIDPQGRCLHLQCPYDRTSALASKQIDETDFLGFTTVILPKF